MLGHHGLGMSNIAAISPELVEGVEILKYII
jgi:outer membrane receptor protein involved in Fe transport